MTTEDVYEGISIANHYPNDLKSIGLHVIPNFISNQEEHDLMEFLDSQKWNGLGIAPNPELKRRTQQYGYLFSYRYRQIQSDQTQLPEPFLPLLSKFNAHKYYLQNQYNHLVINEYEKNQGIMPHIDAPKIFGATIASLSMLSDCVMTFTEKQDESIEYKVHLPRYSVIVMTGINAKCIDL
ncbi:hypothetical protein HDV02_004907 [Globomyces sp. JEL0801]|nr:hypothetical protein HDV02_004907 [Globomyces sp. JEL0801]